jgi:hypothetical protein
VKDGTTPAIAHDGWHRGAVVLVITQRSTQYERVTCHVRTLPGGNTRVHHVSIHIYCREE